MPISLPGLVGSAFVNVKATQEITNLGAFA